MNSTLPVVTGLDGKTYPRFQLSADDGDFLIATCHHLAHDQGLSCGGSSNFSKSTGAAVGRLNRRLSDSAV